MVWGDGTYRNRLILADTARQNVFLPFCLRYGVEFFSHLSFQHVFLFFDDLFF